MPRKRKSRPKHKKVPYRKSRPKDIKVPYRDDEALGAKTVIDMPPLYNGLYEREKKPRKK